ncbi:MAG TPA: cytochrome d ubiquinol oxidase subunit II [Solirubrobacterales bacterium]|nr:cytochrome d ubiquinol oxidase subunit II [Solirubrobacterales bacterium]
MLPELAAALLVVSLTAYAVLGGADFGAGFWDLTAGSAQHGARIRGMIKRSMGPVWEANHVWLIVVLVVMWTCFPPAFAAIMETLYVPIFLAGVGIILRGGAFALRGEAATISEARVLGAVFALSSVITPFFFGAALGAVAAGEVPVGEAGDPWSSWTGPVSLFAGAAGVATGAFMAAVFMAGDSERAGLPDLVAAFRTRALGAGVAAGALALGGLLVVNANEERLFDGLTSGLGLVAVIASAAAGLVTLALILSSRWTPARFAASVAVGAMIVGLVVAQRPYFLPGQLTFEDAAAGDSTLAATLISLAIGLLVIVPSLVFLFRLTLAGRLDPDFHPIGTEDEAK